MHAMYEKKLALQAESYIQLKVAYEELSQVIWEMYTKKTQGFDTIFFSLTHVSFFNDTTR